MKKQFLFFLIFRIFCCILFIYQAAMGIKEFLCQKPLSDPKYDLQEKHLRPLICLSTAKFNYQEHDTKANITFTEYRWGNWKTEEQEEEELFNLLSANLSSLIKRIKIYANTDHISSNYEKIKIDIPEEDKNLKEVLPISTSSETIISRFV